MPTISLGNLSTGGTGKTPLAVWLIENFLANKISPAYLSRGYGRKSQGYLRITPSNSPQEAGDEALLISRKFPNIVTAVCEKRAEGAAQIRQNTEAKVLVLDDAFQHLAIYRDVDIVVIDANRLPNEDSLLPAGRLREPLSELYRADIVIVNKLESATQIAKIQEALRAYTNAQCVWGFCTQDWEEWQSSEGQKAQPKSQSVALLASIGNPTFFCKQVEQKGFEVKKKLFYPDHHSFTTKDIETIQKETADLQQIICTEKDFIRMKDFPKDLLEKIIFPHSKIRWIQGEAAVWSRIWEKIRYGIASK